MTTEFGTYAIGTDIDIHQAFHTDGHGSPEGLVDGVPGRSTYTDLDSGNLWVKWSGNGNKGWLMLWAGTASKNQLIYGAVSNPNGSVAVDVGTLAAQYRQKGNPANLWFADIPNTLWVHGVL